MIAIIGAMQEEVDAIVGKIKAPLTKEISHIRFVTGMMKNAEVVVMQSGVAKVAAALSTTVLMEHFKVSCVVNIGTAGGLMENQNVLDVVISTKVAHHDMDLRAFDWPVGFNQEKTCYNADERLIDMAAQIISEKDRVWIGPIASGDSFIAREQQVLNIKKEYPEALCAEMEAAAIAQVCRHYHKPFVVIRSLSDITLHSDNQLTFDEYIKLASERSAIWCERFVEKLQMENLC